MKRILIADDSASVRALVAAELAGFEDLLLERAASGLEAIRLLSALDIQLVLADVHMPDINGLELARFIKADARLRHLPVVLMSTDADEADRRRSLQHGADEHLAKPFTAKELHGLVRKYLPLTGHETDA